MNTYCCWSLQNYSIKILTVSGGFFIFFARAQSPTRNTRINKRRNFRGSFVGSFDIPESEVYTPEFLVRAPLIYSIIYNNNISIRSGKLPVGTVSPPHGACKSGSVRYGRRRIVPWGQQRNQICFIPRWPPRNMLPVDLVLITCAAPDTTLSTT